MKLQKLVIGALTAEVCYLQQEDEQCHMQIQLKMRQIKK